MENKYRTVAAYFLQIIVGNDTAIIDICIEKTVDDRSRVS